MVAAALVHSGLFATSHSRCEACDHPRGHPLPRDGEGTSNAGTIGRSIVVAHRSVADRTGKGGESHPPSGQGGPATQRSPGGGRSAHRRWAAMTPLHVARPGGTRPTAHWDGHGWSLSRSTGCRDTRPPRRRPPIDGTTVSAAWKRTAGGVVGDLDAAVLAGVPRFAVSHPFPVEYGLSSRWHPRGC